MRFITNIPGGSGSAGPPGPPGPPGPGGAGNNIISAAGAWLQSGLAVGDAVVSTAVANTLAASDPSAIALATPFVGFIFAIPAPGTATVVYYGEYPWGGAPLTPGASYFLGVAPGSITTVAPSGPVNSVSLRVGYAKSTTVLMIAPSDPIIL